VCDLELLLVTDLNNQAQQASTSFLVHPSSLYVGSLVAKSFGVAKQPLPIQFIV
jgi:hypothetical protein